MKLKLYHYWRSSASWRVRWAFALKGFECEWVAIDLLSDESQSDRYLKINPQGYVPALEIHESGKPLEILSESMAIIEWAEEVSPQPSLLPGSPLDRARNRRLAEIINSGTQPLQNLNVTERHSSDPAEKKAWNQYWIQRGLTSYEKLVGTTAGVFSMGDSPTLADLFLIPQCYAASRNEVPLQDFPTVLRIYEAALKTEACQKASPERVQPKA